MGAMGNEAGGGGQLLRDAGPGSQGWVSPEDTTHNSYAEKRRQERWVQLQKAERKDLAGQGPQRALTLL
jgi:hypothetical protein